MTNAGGSSAWDFNDFFRVVRPLLERGATLAEFKAKADPTLVVQWLHAAQVRGLVTSTDRQGVETLVLTPQGSCVYDAPSDRTLITVGLPSDGAGRDLPPQVVFAALAVLACVVVAVRRRRQSHSGSR